MKMVMMTDDSTVMNVAHCAVIITIFIVMMMMRREEEKKNGGDNNGGGGDDDGDCVPSILNLGLSRVCSPRYPEPCDARMKRVSLPEGLRARQWHLPDGRRPAHSSNPLLSKPEDWYCDESC